LSREKELGAGEGEGEGGDWADVSSVAWSIVAWSIVAWSDGSSDDFDFMLMQVRGETSAPKLKILELA
jgi:hypothetical protein